MGHKVHSEQLNGEGTPLGELVKTIGMLPVEHLQSRFGDAFLVYSGKSDEMKPPGRRWGATIGGDGRLVGAQLGLGTQTSLVYCVQHTERTLSSSFVSLGRLGATNDVIINDRTVSATHAVIEGNSSRGYVLRDMGSKNGTYINGTAIPRDRPTSIQPGDSIRLGSVILTFLDAEALSLLLRQMKMSL